MRIYFKYTLAFLICISFMSTNAQVQIPEFPQIDYSKMPKQQVLGLLDSYRMQLSTLEAAMDDKGKALLSKKIEEVERTIAQVRQVQFAKNRIPPPKDSYEYHMQEIKRSESIANKMTLGNWFPKDVQSVSSSYSPAIYRNADFRKIIAAPSNPQHLYAATFTGVYQSFDNAATWECITNGLAIDSIKYLHVDAVNENKIVVNISNGNNYITTDAGMNWYSHATSFFNQNIYEIIPSPVFPNVLFRKNIIGNTELDISTDYGKTLHKSNLKGYDFVFKPITSSMYFATAPSGYKYYELKISHDTCYTASLLYSLPTNRSILKIAVSPNHFNVVYLLVNNPYQILKSTDGGVSFTTTSNVNQSIKPNSISICPGNSNILLHNNYYEDNKILRTVNAGATWDTLNFSYNYCLQIHWANDSTVYLVTDKGLLMSKNYGASFFWAANKIHSNMVWQIAGMPDSLNTFYTVEYGKSYNNSNWYNGISLTKKWSTHNLKTTKDSLRSLIINPVNKNYVFAHSWNVPGKGLYIKRSTNGGTTFSYKKLSTGGNTMDDTLYRSTQPKISMQNPNTIYAMGQHLYKSQNNGNTWTRTLTGLTKFALLWAQSPLDSNVFFAWSSLNTDTLGIYVSLTGGVAGSWKRLSFNTAGTGSLDTTHVKIIPSKTNNKIVYVVNDALFFITKIDFTDINNPIKTGLTMSEIYFTGFWDEYIDLNSFVYQTTPHEGFYIGARNGIYFYSLENNQSYLLSNGLPYCAVSSIYLHESLGLVTIGTVGHGIWQGPIFGACPVSYTHSDGLFQPMVFGTESFEASNSIISTKNIYGGADTKVNYNSGYEITLSPGFDCKAGSSVDAYIQGCTLPAKIAAPLKGNYLGEYPKDETLAQGKLNSNLVANNIALFPNPAHDYVTIEYQLLQGSAVQIELADIFGRVIKVIASEPRLEEGAYKQQWSLYGVNKGTYMVYVTINGNKQVHKLVVIDK